MTTINLHVESEARVCVCLLHTTLTCSSSCSWAALLFSLLSCSCKPLLLVLSWTGDSQPEHLTLPPPPSFHAHSLPSPASAPSPPATSDALRCGPPRPTEAAPACPSAHNRHHNDAVHTSTLVSTHRGLQGLAKLLGLLDNRMLVLLQLLHPALQRGQLEGEGGQGSQGSRYQGGVWVIP